MQHRPTGQLPQIANFPGEERIHDMNSRLGDYDFFCCAFAPLREDLVDCDSIKLFSSLSSSFDSLPPSTRCETSRPAEPSKTLSTSLPTIPLAAASRVTVADHWLPRVARLRRTRPFSSMTLSIVATVVVATGRSRRS